MIVVILPCDWCHQSLMPLVISVMLSCDISSLTFQISFVLMVCIRSMPNLPACLFNLLVDTFKLFLFRLYTNFIAPLLHCRHQQKWVVLFPVHKSLTHSVLLMLICPTVFFPFLECLPCGPTIISLQSVHDEHVALIFEILLKHGVFSRLVSNLLCKIASFML